MALHRKACQQCPKRIALEREFHCPGEAARVHMENEFAHSWDTEGEVFCPVGKRARRIDTNAPIECDYMLEHKLHSERKDAIRR